MKKYLLTLLSLIAVTTLSAQTLKIYEYDENGNLCSTPIFTTTKKVKVVVEKEIQDFASQDLKPGTRIEGKVIVNGDTITKGVGGVVPEYVDLGMRDAQNHKILWATHNLGASAPEEYGAYISFGELGDAESGYVKGVKDPVSCYSKASTKYVNPKNGRVTKYCDSPAAGDAGFMDSKTELETCDDAAAVNLGGNWRTPNYFEFMALASTKSYTWKKVDGGYEIISKVSGFEGNSIFLPLPGYVNEGEISQEGAIAFYMTSTPAEGKPLCAKLNPTSSKTTPIFPVQARYNGLSIRPILIE